MCDCLLMRGNYGGRLEAKQMKIPTRAVYTLDMNEYDIGDENFHSQHDLEGEGCDYGPDFYNGINDEGQSLADDGQQLEGDDDNDIYRQLAQKEKDLLLAAELGKALLEKNEELSRNYELLQEEYSTVVEVRKNNYFNDAFTRD